MCDSKVTMMFAGLPWTGLDAVIVAFEKTPKIHKERILSLTRMGNEGSW